MTRTNSSRMRTAGLAGLLFVTAATPALAEEPAAVIPRPLGRARVVSASAAAVLADVLADLPQGLPLELLLSDQGNVLRAAKRKGDVLLALAATNLGLWRIYRDDDKAAIGATPLATVVAAGAIGETLIDPDAAGPDGIGYYAVRGIAPCTGLVTAP